MKGQQANEQFYKDLYKGKNQAYGSYVLRRNEKRHAVWSFLFGGLLISLFYLAPYLWIRYKESREAFAHIKVDQTPTVQYSELMPPPPIEVIPPPPTIEQPPQPASIQYTKPIIKPDDLVPEDTYIPTQDDFQKANPGLETIEGSDSILIAQPVVVVPPQPQPEPEEVFVIAEKEPMYPGGLPALSAYLSKEIRYPALAREAGIYGTVHVQFVVGKDGNISQAKVLRGIGAGCDEEALRVIQNMPKWIPGEQAGYKVNVLYAIPIRFTLVRD